MKLFVLILTVIASEIKEAAENGPENEKRHGKNEDNPFLVKTEEDEYVKVNKKSTYIGVTYHTASLKWLVLRWNRDENKNFSNGVYDDEETAAHASDTLARKLMENGKQKFKLNFPGDHTEVYPKKDKRFTSKFIGVSYHENTSKWQAQRYNKDVNKTISNGVYDDEETAAHASDTLARKLMGNGEQKHKLNFPDDHTEVYPEKSSKFIGVSYNKRASKWYVQRRSKNENKVVTNGSYDNEKTAAHASDTLARKLMENGEQKLKLNFPDDHTEVCPSENQKKRKRQNEISQKHPKQLRSATVIRI